jgi:hypothetical protein
MPSGNWEKCCRCCAMPLVKGRPGYPMFCTTCDARDPEMHPLEWCIPMEPRKKGVWDAELRRWVTK